MEVLTSGRASRPTSVEALYQRYSRDVFALAYRSVGSRTDAEDVAQTTFLNAHRALLGGVRPASERAWLLAITRNVCHHRFRALLHRPREEELDEAQFEARETDPEVDGGILEALGTLPPRQRQAIVLQALHGCSAAEIGERLGLGAAAVDALLFRARSALRDELQALELPVECARTEALVERQLAHELAGPEQTTLRAHLRTCASCASQARSLRARRRVASLLLWPWELVSRLAGVAAPGGIGVKAATVIALALGATAAERSIVSDGRPSSPNRTAPATTVRAGSAAAPPTAGIPTLRIPAHGRAATPTPAAGVRPPAGANARPPVAGAPGVSTPAPAPGSHTGVPAAAPSTPTGGTQKATAPETPTEQSLVTTATEILETVGVPELPLPELPLPELPEIPELPVADVDVPSPAVDVPSANGVVDDAKAAVTETVVGQLPPLG